jgi:hypothetical protein
MDRSRERSRGCAGRASPALGVALDVSPARGVASCPTSATEAEEVRERRATPRARRVTSLENKNHRVRGKRGVSRGRVDLPPLGSFLRVPPASGAGGADVEESGRRLPHAGVVQVEAPIRE